MAPNGENDHGDLDGIVLPPDGRIARRRLGRTGVQVSMLGLGGHHIGRPADEQEGIRLVQMAVDHGIDFLDNCWDYNDGKSEDRMGKALQGGYRDGTAQNPRWLDSAQL